MDKVCCKMTGMDQYTPTDYEVATARRIDSYVAAMMEGKLDGVGFCAVDNKGGPSFFYMNKSKEAVLRPALNKLMGLYEAGMQFKDKMNAPPTNRSYAEH